MRIAVYCGSQMGNGTRYRDAARELGNALAERGHTLVYGGAMVGTMGVLADAVLDAGGEVIGVIPRDLVDREVAHTGLTELHVVADMHERKAMMAQHAEAFVVLPGGAGTLEEFFEMWTWGQLGLHGKPIGLLDEAGYYQPLRGMIEHMVTEGFLRPEHRDMLNFQQDPAALLDTFATYQAPSSDKWASTG